MDRPDATAIIGWSKLDFGVLNYDETTLQVVVDRAIALVETITGRVLDATMPSGLDTIAQAVVQRMTEVYALQNQPEVLETLGDFELLSSFSAGSYSESRRSLTELRDARMIVPDPTLNSMLYALMTPDKLDEWSTWFTGENAPAWDVQEVDWSGASFDPLALWPMRL